MRKKQIFIAAIVGLITFLVYLPALQNGFVNWDDNKYVFENPHIQSLNLRLLKWAFFEFYFSNWHPLTNISYAVDYAIWGLNPFGYHLVNNIFHALNTLLVVLLSAQILTTIRDKSLTGITVTGRLSDKAILMASAITGLLFGIHPIHVESVAWVSQRKDVLCAFFFLLSLMSYIRYAVNLLTPSFPLKLRGMKGGYLLSLLFFILALMSKPMAVTLPVVMLILDWYPLGRLNRETIKVIFIEKIPFFALSLASSILTLLAPSSVGTLISLEIMPLSTRLVVSAKAIVSYIWKMLLPLNLMPFYPYPKDVSLLSLAYLLPVLLVIGITLTCILVLKKQKLWLTVWGYYLITLLPVLGIIQIGGQSMADRYAYLPSLGPFLIISLIAAWVYETKRQVLLFKLSGSVITLLVLIFLSYATVQQIGIWKNSLALWNYVIEKEPEKIPFAYNNLGIAYRDKGMFDKAIEYFQIAIRLKPYYAEAYNNLGIAYKDKGMFDKAIEHFQIAIRLNPDSALAYNNLGAVYANKGLFDKAIEHFQIAIRLKPDFALAYNNLGIIYMKTGMIDKAIGDFQTALKINPNYADVHFNLAMAYAGKSMMGEAARHYQEVIRLNPNDEAKRNILNRILQGKTR